jgi:hypothetical protein
METVFICIYMYSAYNSVRFVVDCVHVCVCLCLCVYEGEIIGSSSYEQDQNMAAVNSVSCELSGLRRGAVGYQLPTYLWNVPEARGPQLFHLACQSRRLTM